MRKLIVVASLASLALPGFAEGIYVTGSLGHTIDVGTKKGEIDRELAQAGASNISSGYDSHSSGLKLKLGYELNEYVSVEAGYVNLGKFKYTAAATQGNFNASAKADGWDVAVIGSLPLDKDFSLLGKIGAINARLKTDASFAANGLNASAADSDRKWHAVYGVGLGYKVNQAVSLRLEYERYSRIGNKEQGKSDIDMISGGATYKF